MEFAIQYAEMWDWDKMSFVKKYESKDNFKLTENKYEILYFILVIMNSVLDMPNKEILVCSGTAV